MTTRLTALAILCASAAGALAAPMELGALGLLMPLLAVLLGPRLKLSVSAQVTLSFVAAVVGVLAVRLLLPEPFEHNIRSLSERELLFLLPLLLTAGLRALLFKPRFGSGLTIALGLLALTAGGGALSGWMFPVLAAAFCVTSTWALAAEDPHRRRRLSLTRVTLGALLLSGALLAGITTSAGLLLPRVHAAMMAKLQQSMRSSRVGFSNQLQLGDMSGLLQDSRVVLRVRGEQVPDLLRGVVFNQYLEGRWFSSRRSDLETVIAAGARTETRGLAQTGQLELEHARRPERYFLPADAVAVQPSEGGYSRDDFGIIYPPETDYAKRVRFRRASPGQERPADGDDLVVPEALRAELLEVLRDWGVGPGSPGQRLDAIQRRLATFHYTLESERRTTSDPVIDFLRQNPEGHCEYFASAMALLARTAGVPARLVSGYRVAEVSPFGYHIVRKLHAHSWVEAWQNNRWLTLDPTPSSELLSANASETPLFSALVDGVRTVWAAADDWLEARTSFEIVLVLVLLSGLLVVLRTRRHWQQRALPPDPEQPLAGFVALDESLTRKGLPRTRSETVERFAVRIEQAPQLSESQRRQVAGALRDYSLLRYAGRGDEQTVDRSLLELSRSL